MTVSNWPDTGQRLLNGLLCFNVRHHHPHFIVEELKQNQTRDLTEERVNH